MILKHERKESIDNFVTLFVPLLRSDIFQNTNETFVTKQVMCQKEWVGWELHNDVRVVVLATTLSTYNLCARKEIYSWGLDYCMYK